MPSKESAPIKVLDKGVLYQVKFAHKPDSICELAVEAPTSGIALRISQEGNIFYGQSHNGHSPREAESQEELAALTSQFSEKYLTTIFPNLEASRYFKHAEVLRRFRKAIREERVNYIPQSNPSTTT